MNNPKWIDLTHTLDEKILNFRNLPGCKFETIWDYDACTSKTKFKVDKISINAGLGTHIDSPSHCFKDSNCVAEILTNPDYNGYIFDVSELCLTKNIRTITDSHFRKKLTQISVKSLRECFVVIKTGWGKFWGSDKYHNNYDFPHISEDAAKFLLQEGIVGLGIDTLSPDKVTEEGFYPAHEMFLSKDIWIIENVANLDDLSDVQGIFTIAPLKVITSEAPVRMFFREK